MIRAVLRTAVRVAAIAVALAACGHVVAAETDATPADVITQSAATHMTRPAQSAPANPAQTVTQSAPTTPETKAEFAEAYKTYQQLSADGKRDEALPYAERAYRLGLQIYGENHKNSAALALNYGETLDRTGHRAEAVPILDQALDLYQKLYGADSRDMVDPLMARGNASGAWNLKEQISYYDQAIAIARRDATPTDLLSAHLNLEAGIHLLRDGNVDPSKPYLQDAYDEYRKQLAANDGRLLIAAFWLGKYNLAIEKPRDAEPYFTQVLAATEAPGASPNPLTEGAHVLLVDIYQQLNQPEKATPHCIAVGRLDPWTGKEPAPIYEKKPVYPQEGKGHDGYALIEFTIDAAGFVRDPKLLKTEGSDAFGKPGLDTIASWRYAPRFVDGKPVDTTGVQAKVEFKLIPSN
jgi:TonB family protein